MKVLLVVNEGYAAAAAAPLREAGWQIAAASDVPSALAVARRESPDVIVVNDQLPGGGGRVLVTRLRGLLTSALTPIVALTSDEVADQEMRTAGATESLPGNANTPALLATLNRAVHGKRPAAPQQVPVEALSDPHRLSMLEATDLKAGDSDQWFDTVTRIAVDLLPAASSLISLVGHDLQYFPGRTDLDPAGGARQTPLSQSFCQWAVTSGQQLLIEDARRHDVLRANEATTALGVTAYAGVPIEVDGATLGTMCAMDHQPRRWDQEDVLILTRLASVAQAELALRIGEHSATDEQVDAPQLALANVNQGIANSSALLASLRSHASRRSFNGLLELIDGFNERLLATKPGRDVQMN